MHSSRWRLLRRGLEFHECTINKSAHTKKRSGNLFNDPRIYIYIYIYHQVVLLAWIFQTFSLPLSLSLSIRPYRPSLPVDPLHWICTGLFFVRSSWSTSINTPMYRRTKLVSSSLLLQQSRASLVCLFCMVLMMGGCGCTAVVSLGFASKICSIEVVAFLRSFYLGFLLGVFWASTWCIERASTWCLEEIPFIFSDRSDFHMIDS